MTRLADINENTLNFEVKWKQKSQKHKSAHFVKKNNAQIKIYGGEKGDTPFPTNCIKCEKRLDGADKWYSRIALIFIIAYTYGVIILFKWIIYIISEIIIL